MNRTKPLLRRSPLRSAAPSPRPCKQIDYTPTPRPTARATAQMPMATPVPKHGYVRDTDYLRWVASLPCAHCGRVGRSQAAHSDDNGAGGKGMGIKASDDTAYPACADDPGRRGCHWLLGSSGLFTRWQRHALEERYAAQTREKWKERHHA